MNVSRVDGLATSLAYEPMAGGMAAAMMENHGRPVRSGVCVAPGHQCIYYRKEIVALPRELVDVPVAGALDLNLLNYPDRDELLQASGQHILGYVQLLLQDQEAARLPKEFAND